MGAETILELKNITKRFGTLTANDNINFKLKKGTVHAIIGENGAGKSTLMNIISNIYKQDSGEIFLHGNKVHFKDPMDACRHGIGMVYQEFMLFDNLTVLENIMMGFEQKKAGVFLDKKKSREAIEEICETYHFHIPLDDYVANLPVSLLQQVEIVKVLYRGAEILILDEPTSILTPQGIEGLFQAIRFLVASEKTVIFITHKLKEVLAISDEITVLRSGTVVGSVRPQDVSEEQLANLMVGRDVLLTLEKQEKREEKNSGIPVLDVENLTVKDSNGNVRVKNVSFSVQAGEIVGVAGVANSGQGQMVEAIYGLREAEEGSKILFKGKDITGYSCRQHRCEGIGYVPQDRLHDGVNVQAPIWESAIMGYHVAHGFKNPVLLDYEEINRFTGQILEEYAVKAPDQYARVGTLSGGNIQKLIVGREFSQKNSLLIIEDPTRGIDIGAIEFIWKKIVEIAASGVGILLISHELNEIMELSDRIIVMYDGRLFDGGKSKELSEEEIGFLMMGGAQNEV